MSVWLRLILLVSIGLVFQGAGVGGGCRGARERASIPTNPDWFVQTLHWTARGIEAVGIAIIVLGGLVSSFYFLWQLLNS